jgi:hypothetical protein
MTDQDNGGPSALDMVIDLDVALHGRTWARPSSPKAVWESLLDEVRELVRHD